MSSKFKNDPKKKRYYWLQLKTDFFDQKEIKLLRKIAGGDTYTVIYLKMLLASLKDDGKLYFESIGDDFAEEISLLIDEEPENVAITIKFLETKQLIEVVEEDEYFLNRVPEMVGSESYSAERMRNMRERKKLKGSLSDVAQSQCDSDVTKRRDRVREELEKENKNTTSGNPNDVTIGASEIIPYKKIIDYLNSKANKNFRNVEANKKLIRARWNEGYRQSDFEKVIDNMVTNWKGVTFDSGPAENYLQPKTLFSNKFDHYLNQVSIKKTEANKPPVISGEEVRQWQAQLQNGANEETYSEIVEHLNRKAGTDYKSTSGDTQKLIDARLSEGFTVADFKQVIDTKSNEWSARSDMVQYLRPETLFSTKFESYLNQKAAESKSKEQFNTHDDRYHLEDMPF